MLSNEEILIKLKDILTAMGSIDEQTILNADFSTRLSQDLGITSVGMLYIVIAIEESFSIQFENIGMDDFKTVGDVVNFIKGKLG